MFPPAVSKAATPRYRTPFEAVLGSRRAQPRTRYVFVASIAIRCAPLYQLPTEVGAPERSAVVPATPSASPVTNTPVLGPAKSTHADESTKFGSGFSAEPGA